MTLGLPLFIPYAPQFILGKSALASAFLSDLSPSCCRIELGSVLIRN
jgi:hypothetical protein